MDCTQVFEVVHVYAESSLYGGNPERELPEVYRHLLGCADCLRLYTGLLAALLADLQHPTDEEDPS